MTRPLTSPSARAARIQAAADLASRRAERNAVEWRDYEAADERARRAYDRHMAAQQVLNPVCPTCGAKADEPCVSLGNGLRTETHTARLSATGASQ